MTLCTSISLQIDIYPIYLQVLYIRLQKARAPGSSLEGAVAAPSALRRAGERGHDSVVRESGLLGHGAFPDEPLTGESCMSLGLGQAVSSGASLGVV